MFDLGGRRALITGSGQGIGYAIASALAEAGAAVVLNGRTASRIEAAAERLRAAGGPAGGTVSTAAFDVTDSAAAAAETDRIERDDGPIDILVNNAGIQRRAPLDRFTDEDWHAIVRANLDSVFFMSRAVARHMIGRGRGKIINIGSVQSTLGRQTIAPYAATKGAVALLTRGMCADWARHGIQANALSPGYFRTELNQALVDDAAFSEWLCRRTPSGRWGEVHELGGAAVFLASAASDFVNGQMLTVDGGLTAVV